jgi:hypothetical protein
MFVSLFIGFMVSSLMDEEAVKWSRKTSLFYDEYTMQRKTKLYVAAMNFKYFSPSSSLIWNFAGS